MERKEERIRVVALQVIEHSRLTARPRRPAKEPDIGTSKRGLGRAGKQLE